MCSSPPPERTAADVQRIRSLLNGNRFFDELEPDVASEVCRQMKYLEVPADRVLFHKGDLSDSWYLIVKGKVGVYVDEVSCNANVSQELTQEDETLGDAGGRGEAEFPEYSEESSSTARAGDTSADLGRVDMTSLVAVLEEGESFGELGLIQNDVRSAALVTHTACAFLVVDKASFDRCLRRSIQRKTDDKVAQLRAVLPGVQDLRRLIVEQISYFFHLESYKRGFCFAKEGEHSSSLFLLVEGECIIRSHRRRLPADFVSMKACNLNLRANAGRIDGVVQRAHELMASSASSVSHAASLAEHGPDYRTQPAVPHPGTRGLGCEREHKTSLIRKTPWMEYPQANNGAHAIGRPRRWHASNRTSPAAASKAEQNASVASKDTRRAAQGYCQAETVQHGMKAEEMPVVVLGRGAVVAAGSVLFDEEEPMTVSAHSSDVVAFQISRSDALRHLPSKVLDALRQSAFLLLLRLQMRLEQQHGRLAQLECPRPSTLGAPLEEETGEGYCIETPPDPDGSCALPLAWSPFVSSQTLNVLQAQKRLRRQLTEQFTLFTKHLADYQPHKAVLNRAALLHLQRCQKMTRCISSRTLQHHPEEPTKLSFAEGAAQSQGRCLSALQGAAALQQAVPGLFARFAAGISGADFRTGGASGSAVSKAASAHARERREADSKTQNSPCNGSKGNDVPHTPGSLVETGLATRYPGWSGSLDIGAGQLAAATSTTKEGGSASSGYPEQARHSVPFAVAAERPAEPSLPDTCLQYFFTEISHRATAINDRWSCHSATTRRHPSKRWVRCSGAAGDTAGYPAKAYEASGCKQNLRTPQARPYSIRLASSKSLPSLKIDATDISNGPRTAGSTVGPAVPLPSCCLSRPRTVSLDGSAPSGVSLLPRADAQMVDLREEASTTSRAQSPSFQDKHIFPSVQASADITALERDYGSSTETAGEGHAGHTVRAADAASTWRSRRKQKKRFERKCCMPPTLGPVHVVVSATERASTEESPQRWWIRRSRSESKPALRQQRPPTERPPSCGCTSGKISTRNGPVACWAHLLDEVPERSGEARTFSLKSLRVNGIKLVGQQSRPGNVTGNDASREKVLGRKRMLEAWAREGACNRGRSFDRRSSYRGLARDLHRPDSSHSVKPRGPSSSIIAAPRTMRDLFSTLPRNASPAAMRQMVRELCRQQIQR